VTEAIEKIDAVPHVKPCCSEHQEWAVDYEVDGEPFMYRATDEEDARRVRAALDGTLFVRTVFEMCWACFQACDLGEPS